ncbi:recombinase family protein [Bartonella harrusi]|uniref:Recombinase family protein n=1 Tax=Bartonella harrusi TaxID=2961895 RepID=A0ABY5EUM0_9HYPH|nr:recombinase family protein [Bartonella harrusi]UTO27665.1 recombinase family protein [Bartonella harrusi]
MTLLGYARVSTHQQKLTLQINALKEVGVREDRIFTDMITGSTDKREGLQRLLGRAERDDIIICTKMDRLGRNTADMIRIIDDCYKKGITFRFLENNFSTEGAMGKMVVQILLAVAEAERVRILERTMEGRAAAIEAGVRLGRKPHPKTEIALSLIKNGFPLKVVQKKTGISRITYFRLKRQINGIKPIKAIRQPVFLDDKYQTDLEDFIENLS